MDDLVRWLKAQLSADEAAAEDTLTPELRAGRFRGKEIPRWRITKYGEGIIDEDGGRIRAQQIFPAEAAHVIRHDPSRVLREIDAKRRTLALHSAPTGHGCSTTDKTGYNLNYDEVSPEDACTTLRLLALPYADRPGFQEGWRP